MFQPLVHSRGGGASCGSPAGAFAFDHASRIAISCAVSDGSFAKCPMAAIGEPRRHFPACGDEGDRASFGLRFFVGHQRERADFAGPVAALAVLLKNRQHIAIESRARFQIDSRPRHAEFGDRSEMRWRRRTARIEYLNAVAWHEHRRISYAFERLGCKRERTIAIASRIGGSRLRGRLRSLESGRGRNRRTSFRRSCRDAHRVERRQRLPTNRAGPR